MVHCWLYFVCKEYTRYILYEVRSIDVRVVGACDNLDTPSGKYDTAKIFKFQQHQVLYKVSVRHEGGLMH